MIKPTTVSEKSSNSLKRSLTFERLHSLFCLASFPSDSVIRLSSLCSPLTDTHSAAEWVYSKYHNSIWQRAPSFPTVTQIFAEWLHCSNRTRRIQHLCMYMSSKMSWRSARSFSKLWLCVNMCTRSQVVLTACCLSSFCCIKPTTVTRSVAWLSCATSAKWRVEQTADGNVNLIHDILCFTKDKDIFWCHYLHTQWQILQSKHQFFIQRQSCVCSLDSTSWHFEVKSGLVVSTRNWK